MTAYRMKPTCTDCGKDISSEEVEWINEDPVCVECFDDAYPPQPMDR